MSKIPKEPNYSQADLTAKEQSLRNKYSNMFANIPHNQLDVQIGMFRQTVNIIAKTINVADYEEQIFIKTADKSKLQQLRNANNEDCTICFKNFSRKLKQTQCQFCAKVCCTECCFRTRPNPQQQGERSLICDICDGLYKNLTINQDFKAEELLINETMQKIAKQVIKLEKAIQKQQEMIQEQQQAANLQQEDMKKVMKISKLKSELNKNTKDIDKISKQIQNQAERQRKLNQQISIKQAEIQQKAQKKIQQAKLRQELAQKKLLEEQFRLRQQQRRQKEIIQNELIVKQQIILLQEKKKIEQQQKKKNRKLSTESKASQKSEQLLTKSKGSDLQKVETTNQTLNKKSIEEQEKLSESTSKNDEKFRNSDNPISSNMKSFNTDSLNGSIKEEQSEKKTSLKGNPVRESQSSNKSKENHFPIESEFFEQTKVQNNFEDLTRSNLSIQEVPDRTVSIQRRLSKKLTESQILAMRVPSSNINGRVSVQREQRMSVHRQEQGASKRKLSSSFKDQVIIQKSQKPLNKQQILQKSRKEQEEEGATVNVIDEKNKCTCSIF